jgi:hypothetical protein
MRYITMGLLLCAACSGGGSTGPAAVASVQLNAPTNTIAVGQTTTITAIALDASGTATTSGTVTWQTSSAAIATVTAGLVTGVTAGSAAITATIGTKSSQTNITVTPPISTSCSGITPLSLSVGAVHTLTGAERSTLCISGGAAGSEYVLVPFKADTVSAPVSVLMTGSGTLATSGAPTAAAAASLLPAPASTRLLSSVAHGAFGAAFEHRMRVIERNQLTPLVTAGQRSTLLRSMQRASASRSAIFNLPSTPALGTFFKLNANGNDACTNRQNHTARIAAVSNAAIIAVDSLAPAGGFTDAEYAVFAATFDTLIFPLDTAAYGAPADLDNNGRVLIFFTQAVNQLTPPGSGGYIGGFFFARDLFPDTTQNSLLEACPASNQGEMFYVPVVDAASLYNGFFTDKTALRIELIGTLAHEFQHLINASRRLYVTQTPNWDEDVWLNEGMSHIAEEILYFHEAGFAPKQNLVLSTVAGNQAALDAINNYQVQNLARLEEYLKAPGLNSPYAENDSLPTRGSTYELLRYSMDESAQPNSVYLHALINTQNTGIVNYNTVFAGTFPNIFTAVQQQVLANFFGGSGIAVDPKYAFPSWNYRDVIGNGLNKKVNPLTMQSLAGSATFGLTGGGVGYGRFSVASGGTGSIVISAAGGAVPANVVMLLIRTQ